MKKSTFPDRTHLEFTAAVLHAFHFLETEFGFRCTIKAESSVRFESERVFVRLFHGAISYEVGCQLNLLETSVETGFNVRHLAEHNGLAGRRMDRSAQTKAEVWEAVAELADLLSNYGTRALRGEKGEFAALQEEIEAHWKNEAEARRIAITRPRAYNAFKEKDYKQAASLYSSIESSLTKAEGMKLRYARKHMCEEG